MFRIQKVRLSNICQHEDFAADIETGLTAITGPNGSGKTSLLRGLVYALTGLVDGSWGTQQSLQKDATAVPGFAEVVVAGPEGSYAIRRYSVAASAKFPDTVTRDDGVEVARRRSAVDAFVQELTGIPVQLMFQVCWGRQGELSSLLKATPATVSAFLSRVFDVTRLETLRERLKVVIDKIAALPGGVETNLANDRRALQELPGEEALQHQLSQCALQLKEAQDALQALKARAGSALAAADLQAAIHKTEQELHAASIRAAQLDDVAAEAPPDTPASLLYPEVRQASLRVVQTRQLLSESLARLSAAQERLQARKMARERSRIVREAALEAASVTESGECPFCGGAVEDVAAYRKRMLAILDSSAQDASPFDEDAQAAVIASLERESEHLARSVKEAEEKANAIDRKFRAAQRQEALHAVEYLDNELKELKGTPVRSRELDDELAAGTREVSRLQALRDSLVAQIASTRARREMLTKAVADDVLAVKRFETNTNARLALNELRDALSAPRAQARYLKNRIVALNARLSRYMEQTRMPFTLRLDPDKRCFVFRNADGVEHPACHLSGAQQGMCAVALQMALLDVMRPGMNLYLIDEPTEALDENNKEVMASMFASMSRMLPAVSGTMLIVTRDESAIQACNARIEVGD